MEILVPMPVVNDLQSGNARDRYPQPTSLSCFAQTALTAGQTKQTKKKKVGPDSRTWTHSKRLAHSHPDP